MPFAYSSFLDIVAKVFLVLGVIAGAVCVIDWAIRTRKIGPFSAVARFFRRTVDPLLRPVEEKVVRYGGQPAAAPLWTFLGVVVAGILILQVLGVIGSLLTQISVGISSPRLLVGMIAGWAIRFVTLALIVRVISTWLPVSPYSKWIRWSYVSTEWLLAPLRRVIPPFGAFDVTPIVAYLLLVIVGGILGL
jgi:YggT family protein